jgi:hypothetical protein
VISTQDELFFPLKMDEEIFEDRNGRERERFPGCARVPNEDKQLNHALAEAFLQADSAHLTKQSHPRRCGKLLTAPDRKAKAIRGAQISVLYYNRTRSRRTPKYSTTGIQGKTRLSSLNYERAKIP